MPPPLVPLPRLRVLVLLGAVSASLPAHAAPLGLAADSAAGPVFDLQAALTAAVAHHPSLRASRAQTDAARARIDVARIPNLPTASLDGGVGVRNSFAQGGTDSAFAQSGGVQPRPYWAATAQGRWTVLDFGRTQASMAAARHGAEAARADEQTVREQLWLTVTQAYLQAVAAEVALASLQEAQVQATRHRDLARVRVEAQIRPPLDALKAESDLAAAQVAVLRGEEAVRAARVTLGVAMGVARAPEGRLQAPTWNAPELAADDLGTDARLEALVQETATKRPEIQALAERVRAAREEAHAFERGSAPGLYAGGQTTVAGIEDRTPIWTVALTAGVAWPVSAMWTAKAQATEASSRARALEAQREGLVLQLRSEIDQARTALIQARKRLPALQVLIQVTEKARDHASKRYEAGAAAMLELTDAETALTQARLQMVQAELDIAVATARLLRALGKMPTF